MTSMQNIMKNISECCKLENEAWICICEESDLWLWNSLMQLKQKKYKYAYAWDILPSEDTTGTLVLTASLLPKFSNGKETDTEEGMCLALLKFVMLCLFDILGRSASFWRETEEWIWGRGAVRKGTGTRGGTGACSWDVIYEGRIIF